ncbi:hypothetical protein G7Y89_g3395 [Cudoniella acicularis]|uniref:Cytochrome P450 n=1 Tax=Cudoniella acicularis TaxID=354080 RepID=A0A8H4W5M3_9HELO|nr:hypothetical protein G7Y89_g3395 [Cudoniella acicularis]
MRCTKCEALSTSHRHKQPNLAPQLLQGLDYYDVSKPFGGLAIIFILFASYILYLICLVVYNLCFHPLRKFPGPKSFAATPIPYAFYQITGQLPYLYSTLHKKYGSVVRVLPNEISFNNPAAWREIYGTRPGHELLTKDPKSFAPSNEGAYNIVTVSNVADHARYRNALNPAFSEKALREQEPLIITSVDLLMERLHKNCATGEPQDMVHWFNLAMFDIMAELTFGESLEGLQTSKYHPWLEGLLGSALKYVSFTRVTARFPHIARLLNLWVPKSLLEQRVKHQKFSWDMVERRLNNHPPFRDFMSYILPYDEKTATMTLAEMRATYGVMILAGSENLVATLTITLYHLLRHPDIMEKVSREVREAFPQKENITFDATNALRYLPAALTESMRIQPAAPSSQPRVVPQGGENLCGHFVPGGVGIQKSGTTMILPKILIKFDLLAKLLKDVLLGEVSALISLE